MNMMKSVKVKKKEIVGGPEVKAGTSLPSVPIAARSRSAGAPSVHIYPRLISFFLMQTRQRMRGNRRTTRGSSAYSDEGSKKAKRYGGEARLESNPRAAFFFVVVA